MLPQITSSTSAGQILSQIWRYAQELSCHLEVKMPRTTVLDGVRILDVSQAYAGPYGRQFTGFMINFFLYTIIQIN
jgi:hypothetical protein